MTNAHQPAGLSEKYASQWEDAAMADAYPTRPPYPDAVFDFLVELSEGGSVLDLGCGTGDVARPLAPRVVRLRAVDRSAAMIARGKTLPGGDHPHLEWCVGRAEAEKPDEYATTTIGEALHWFDWSRLGAIPRLAVIERRGGLGPWSESLQALIVEHSTNTDFEPYDALQSLAAAERWQERGSTRLPETPYQQSIADFITSIHSRNGFSTDRMTPESRQTFDEAAATILEPHTDREGMLRFGVSASIRWGHLLAGSPASDPADTRE